MSITRPVRRDAGNETWTFVVLSAILFEPGCQLDYEGGLLNLNVNAGDGAVSLNWNGDAGQSTHPGDRDEDGVPDSVDQCPDDPVGGDPEWFAPPGCHDVADGWLGPPDVGQIGEPDAGGTAACPGGPLPEICNLVDDDCDGLVDEGLGVGMPCVAGVGYCARAGGLICNAAGGVVCSTQAGEPGIEVCNLFDDDCDGLVDEGFNLGIPCVAGTGTCAAAGVVVCMPDGTGACGAAPLLPETEACDGLDNDCDGTIDNGCP